MAGFHQFADGKGRGVGGVPRFALGVGGFGGVDFGGNHTVDAGIVVIVRMGKAQLGGLLEQQLAQHDFMHRPLQRIVCVGVAGEFVFDHLIGDFYTVNRNGHGGFLSGC